jgi:integrase
MARLFPICFPRDLMKLTETSVARIKLEKGRSEVRIFDDDLPCFGVRYRGGRKRTWFVQYRFGAKQRILSLGAVGTMSADKARKAAKHALAKAQLGHDPYVEKDDAQASAELTLGSVANRFLDDKANKLKPRSLVEVRRHLLRDWKPLARLPLKSITRAHVASQIEVIAKERGAITANHARMSLSTLYSWSMKRGLVDANPVVATELAMQVVPRDRVLADAELVMIWNAAGESDYGRVVKLLLLTGQRREEVGGMVEAELDFDGRRWVIPWQRTKNGRRTRLDHEVPLSDQAIAILKEAPRRQGRDFLFGEGAGGFSGWSKAKQTLDARVARAQSSRHQGKTKAPAAAPWRLHDVRRTCATRLADIGIAPHVIEAVLNHISGHKAGVAGTYNRSLYLPERRQALDRWGAYVAALVAGETTSNVVSLKAHA